MNAENYSSGPSIGPRHLRPIGNGVLLPPDRRPERSGGISGGAKDPEATKWSWEDASICRTYALPPRDPSLPSWPLHLGFDEAELRAFTDDELEIFLTLTGFKILQVLDRKVYAFNTKVIVAH